MNKNKEFYDDSWIYTLLLSSFTIFGIVLLKYKFNLLNQKVPYTVFVLPIIIYIENIIFKKHKNKLLQSIIISGISPMIYEFIFSFIIRKQMVIYIELIVIYLIVSIINYLLNKYINKNTYIISIIKSLLVIIIFYSLYIIVTINTFIMSNLLLYLFIIVLDLLLIIFIYLIEKILNEKDNIIWKAMLFFFYNKKSSVKNFYTKNITNKVTAILWNIWIKIGVIIESVSR